MRYAKTFVTALAIALAAAAALKPSTAQAPSESAYCDILTGDCWWVVGPDGQMSL